MVLKEAKVAEVGSEGNIEKITKERNEAEDAVDDEIEQHPRGNVEWEAKKATEEELIDA